MTDVNKVKVEKYEVELKKEHLESFLLEIGSLLLEDPEVTLSGEDKVKLTLSLPEDSLETLEEIYNNIVKVSIEEMVAKTMNSIETTYKNTLEPVVKTAPKIIASTTGVVARSTISVASSTVNTVADEVKDSAKKLNQDKDVIKAKETIKNLFGFGKKKGGIQKVD